MRNEKGAGTYRPYYAARIKGHVESLFDVVATEDERICTATVVTSNGPERKTLYRSPDFDFMFSDNPDILNQY